MNKLFFIVLYFITLNMFSQHISYKSDISFKSDLWLILTAEEAVRTEGDTIEVTWVQRTVRKRQNTIYIDISKNGTLVGLKYPNNIKLSSEGLPNNGFIGEKWYSEHNMHIQTYAKDETGNIWEISVGKDRLTHDLAPDPTDQGRIYLTIHDTKGIQSGWYFTIDVFGKQKK